MVWVRRANCRYCHSGPVVVVVDLAVLDMAAFADHRLDREHVAANDASLVAVHLGIVGVDQDVAGIAC